LAWRGRWTRWLRTSLPRRRLACIRLRIRLPIRRRGCMARRLRPGRTARFRQRHLQRLPLPPHTLLPHRQRRRLLYRHRHNLNRPRRLSQPFRPHLLHPPHRRPLRPLRRQIRALRSYDLRAVLAAVSATKPCGSMRPARDRLQPPAPDTSAGTDLNAPPYARSRSTTMGRTSSTGPCVMSFAPTDGVMGSPASSQLFSPPSYT